MSTRQSHRKGQPNPAIFAEARAIQAEATALYRTIYDPAVPRSAFTAAQEAAKVYAAHHTTREHVQTLLRTAELRASTSSRKADAKRRAAVKAAGTKKGAA